MIKEVWKSCKNEQLSLSLRHKKRRMNLTTIRLLSQQLTNQQLETPEAVVGWMGAMQAQGLSHFPWAVGIRMRKPSLKAVKAAFDEGRIVRSHLFRTTWQLVPAADLRWMLSLCRERNRRAINGFLRAHGEELDERDYQRCNQLMTEIIAGRSSVQCSELKHELLLRGCDYTRHQLTILLVRAEIDGVICSGDLTEGERSFSLLEEKIPPAPAVAEDEAMRMLARKYFRSHAPATLADFCWWTGLSQRSCRVAVEDIRDELTAEQYQGETFYIHADSRTRGFRPGAVALLPAYDEYLIAYKSRHLVLDPAFAHKAYNRYGLFRPVVLQDGVVTANWSKEPDGRVSAVDFCGRPMSGQSLEKASARLNTFLK